MSPRISVVIPVFNRAVVVRRAIDSVLAQTIQDFEIIVVDDGSTDGTPAAIAAIADPRITLVRHEQNRGGSASRNTGVQASVAPYVAFLDSDDEWLPTKLERQLDVFERSSDRLALVYTGVERVFADGTIVRHVPQREADLTRALLIDNVVGETSLGMARRSALDAIGGFDESLPSCQDLDLWLRLSERFDADVVSEVLVRVEKGDDKGRISANVARTVWGRDLFREKHRAEMTSHGVLYLHHRESGWWQQRRVRDSRKARDFYRQSLRANPFAPLTYAMFFVTFIPEAVLESGATLKHLASKWRRPSDVVAPAAPLPASPASSFPGRPSKDSAA